ncbi:MAG: PaaI family thioesterase [Blautia sp.]|nr:PaaI family thioesterase [Blautia sp.]
MDDKEKIMRNILENNDYIRFLGMEFLEVRQDYAYTRMKYKKEIANPYGTLHGGSLYSLADVTAGTAACMGGYYVTTVSGTMNFMLPADRTEYVYCKASMLRGGKHLAVYEVKLLNDADMLLDSGEFTFYVTKEKLG